MERLGVSHHSRRSSTSPRGEYWPKPHPQIYDALVKKHGIDPTRAAFADDISVNLKPAADIGMRTVWIRTDEA